MNQPTTRDKLHHSALCHFYDWLMTNGIDAEWIPGDEPSVSTELDTHYSGDCTRFIEYTIDRNHPDLWARFIGYAYRNKT